MMEIFEDTVNSETENMRFDRYLKKLCKNESISNIYKGLKNGDIRVNDKKVKENYRLNLGDKIKIKTKFLKIENTKKNKKNKNIIYNKQYFYDIIIDETEDFFIVNKPQNIPMHKGTGHEFGLAEIYKDMFDNANINFANRLDSETRGLVIGCKNLKFLRYISEQIRLNKVQKKYAAIVDGEIKEEEFVIENYLETTENGVKVHERKVNENSKLAITRFSKKELIECPNEAKRTLLEIELITGRKHQIRAQLSNKGFPIVGDKKYGINKNNQKNKEDLLLCCYFLAFDKYEFEIKYDIN